MPSDPAEPGVVGLLLENHARFLAFVERRVGSREGAEDILHAAAIRRVDLDGSSVRAYSVEAGITPSKAGVRLHRAREALRRQLARCCGSCLTHGCLECQCTEGLSGADEATSHRRQGMRA